MAYNNTFLGNIVTADGSEQIVDRAKINISDLGTFYLEDRHAIVEGASWVASDIDYDYETLSRKKLRKINKYKAQWEIKFNFMNRESRILFDEMNSLMEQVDFEFTDTGVRTPRKFFFYPPGDATRPVIEVVKVSSPNVDVTHFANKYIGYNGNSFIIESVEEFNRKILPRTESYPELPADGMISTDGMYVSLEL